MAWEGEVWLFFKVEKWDFKFFPRNYSFGGVGWGVWRKGVGFFFWSFFSFVIFWYFFLVQTIGLVVEEFRCANDLAK